MVVGSGVRCGLLPIEDDRDGLFEVPMCVGECLMQDMFRSGLEDREECCHFEVPVLGSTVVGEGCLCHIVLSSVTVTEIKSVCGRLNVFMSASVSASVFVR